MAANVIASRTFYGGQQRKSNRISCNQAKPMTLTRPTNTPFNQARTHPRCDSKTRNRELDHLYDEDEAQHFDRMKLEDADVHALLAALGSVIRRTRQNRGWLLMDLAERWNGSQSVLCRLELARREATMRQVIQLSTLLGLRPSTVMRAAEDEAFPAGFSPWLNRQSGIGW